MNTEKKLGYEDNLMIMAESFRLWAIESGNERVKEILSFSKADDGIIIADNIEKFRELKLRLLNGTHSFSCGLAILAGFKTVKDAMNNNEMSGFIHDLLMQEIVPAVSNGNISHAEAFDFAGKVLDRFRNPYINHLWSNISLQYSAKMKMRNVPLLLKYYSKTNQPPEYMALGFASYLLFLKCSKNSMGEYVFRENGTEFIVQDSDAAYFADKWSDNDEEGLVDAVLADKDFWKEDLVSLNGFAGLVKINLRSLIKNGAMATIKNLQLNKTIV